MSDAELRRRACATYRAQRAMGGESVPHPHAKIVRARDCPDVWDANHASDVTSQTPAEIDDLLAALDAAMGHARVRKFFCDPFTPEPFLARLAVEGFEREGTVQLVLEGELRARPRAVEIRRAESDADWQSVAVLLAENMTEELRKNDLAPDAAFLRQLTDVRREASSKLHTWLARDGGEDCASFASWSGVEGMGMVEWLFTQEDQRRRGIATALIAHAVSDARARGAGPVLIGASAGPDPVPRRLYASLGFRPVCITEEYTRFV